MTFNAHLKLLMTLAKLVAQEVDVTAEERTSCLAISSGRISLPLLARVHWTMPKTVLPDDIDSTVRIMRDFLRNPIDLDGQTAKDLLRKKRKKPIRRAKRPAPGNNSEDDEVGIERPTKRRKATKRSAELQQFKSAAYIEDSDDAAEADDGFYERELELQRISRQKMLATGHIAPEETRTDTSRPKRTTTQRLLDTQQNSSDEEAISPPTKRASSSAADSDNESASPSSPQATRERTAAQRPAPRRKVRARSSASSPPQSQVDEDERSQASQPSNISDREDTAVNGSSKPNGKRRIIAESEEDE